MPYAVEWRDSARKAFLALDKTVRVQVQRVVDRLADNPRPGHAKPLIGDPRTWRVRAGKDWRILYEIHDERPAVLILELGHRSGIYRDR